MSLSKHERSKNGKEEWLTPPGIINGLGGYLSFDLDPCAPINPPWPTARKHYNINDDGLSLPWYGRVWLNPPYGNKTALWMARLALHGNGLALIYARTETRYWFPHVWKHAAGFYFFKSRLIFHNVDGTPARDSKGGIQKAPAPSVLIAYGEECHKALKVFASVYGLDEYPGHYLPNRI